MSIEVSVEYVHHNHRLVGQSLKVAQQTQTHILTKAGFHRLNTYAKDAVTPMYTSPHIRFVIVVLRRPQ